MDFHIGGVPCFLYEDRDICTWEKGYSIIVPFFCSVTFRRSSSPAIYMGYRHTGCLRSRRDRWTVSKRLGLIAVHVRVVLFIFCGFGRFVVSGRWRFVSTTLCTDPSIASIAHQNKQQKLRVCVQGQCFWRWAVAFGLLICTHRH